MHVRLLIQKVRHSPKHLNYVLRTIVFEHREVMQGFCIDGRIMAPYGVATTTRAKQTKFATRVENYKRTP